MNEQPKKRDTRITVELPTEMHNLVNELSNDLQMSKSQVIRYSLQNNLRDVSALKRKRMSLEDRNLIVEHILNLTNEVNHLSSTIQKTTIQLNELTHALNKADKSLTSTPAVTDVQQLQDDLQSLVNQSREGLNKVWQLLQ